MPAGARAAEGGWFAPRAEVDKPDLPAEIGRAFVIPIHEAITNTMFEVVRRKIVRCRAGGAQIIIFEMDTPGGSGAAMRKIVRLIIDDLRDIYTVAYVNPQAFSAGAIISLACDEIVLSPTAVIGDAMPIMVGPGGQLMPIPEKERGKIESAIRSEIRILAKRNGYNVTLCEAMVTITMEIWLIKNIETNELRIVEAKEWRGRVGRVPTTAPAGTTKPSQMAWQYVRTIDGPDELVTMTADEAVELGFAEHIFDRMEDLRKHYHIAAAPVVLEDNWSESLTTFLTSTVVTSVLLMAAIFFIYIEMNTPGFGVAGTVAVICFAVLFGSRFLIGLANWWEIAMFAVGLLLIGLELFVTPGFGVLGVGGILCCIAAMLAMVIPNAPDKLPIPTTDLDWSVFRAGFAALGIGFIAALIAVVIAAKYLPKVPAASRLILAPAAASAGPAAEDAPIRSIQPGEVGVVEGPCRPVGLVRFGEALIDAVAEGVFIPTGTKVKVIKNEGNRVVVTAIT